MLKRGSLVRSIFCAALFLTTLGRSSFAFAGVKDTVDKAEKIYFAGRLDEALTVLDQAEREEVASQEISPQRARIHLLRMALRAKQGNGAGAEESARKALRLDPELEAGELPPSAQDVVERVRQTLPARVIVKLIGVASGAEARIDGRPVPATGSLTVVPGQHQLSVRTAGKTALQTFSATEDTEVVVRAAIAIAPPSPTSRVVAKPNPFPKPGQSASGKHAAGWALAAVAVTGTGAAGHGFWARSVALQNRSRTDAYKTAYDDDVQKFTAQTAAGGGVALIAGGLSVWLLSSGTHTSAGVLPTKNGAIVGFTMEFGGNDR